MRNSVLQCFHEFFDFIATLLNASPCLECNFQLFFREIVMCTRHPGGNGNFFPGKILAWEEITISSRVTSAHDDFTEKNRNFFWPSLI